MCVSCSARKEPQFSGFGPPVHVQITGGSLEAIPEQAQELRSTSGNLEAKYS